MSIFRVRTYWDGSAFAGPADIHVDGDGRISKIAPIDEQALVVELPGVVLPGFANAHSHAFHRAIRGRTHLSGGTFWTWREQMYKVASQLTPENYYELACAVYGEMVLAGVTIVGEFHYVHHQPNGEPYSSSNAMGEALIAAAKTAGLRLTLLDTCYLAGGLSASGHEPMSDLQRRFSDGDAQQWVDRVKHLKADENTVIGSAIHSVRAVPAAQMRTIVQHNGERPLHIHVSEQPAENQACLAFYGQTPTQLLASHDVLGPNTTAVHATHLTNSDITLLGDSQTYSCFCPTTERDLADGIGPARALLDAGSGITLGSDQNAIIDLLEEVRALEMHERLATLNRGQLRIPELLNSLTSVGAKSLGWADAGVISVGARADFVAIRTDSPRTAGSDPQQIIFSAFASDVHTVVVDGKVQVSDGVHQGFNVADALAKSIEVFWN